MDDVTINSHLDLYEDPLRISPNNINYPQDRTHYVVAHISQESNTLTPTISTLYYLFEYASPQPAPLIALELIRFSNNFTEPDRCLYEVIPPLWNRPFHINIQGNTVDEPLKLIRVVCDAIISFLLQHDLINPDINKKELFYCFSSSSTSHIYYDIILRHFYLNNYLATKSMYEQILPFIPLEYHVFLQHNTYPPIQLSLLYGCSPYTTDSIYSQKITIYNTDETLDGITAIQISLLGLINVSDCSLINISIPTNTLTYNNTIRWKTISPTAKLAFDLFTQYQVVHRITTLSHPAFQFHSQRSNLIKLRRIRPSECPMCKSIHETANAYLYIDTYSGDSIYYKCYECKTRRKSVFIGALHPDESYRPEIAFNINSTPNETYESEYVRPISEALLKHKTLLLQSPMGTGKTRAIIQHVIQHNHSRIIIISCRQIFSQTCVNEYNTKVPITHCKFMNYLDFPHKKYLGDIPRICIQVESLHRLLDLLRQISIYGLVILDEFESSRTQFSSNETLHNPVMVCEVFHMLMKTAPLVIVTDAFLSECGVTIMNLLRERTYVIHNTIKPSPKLAIQKDYYSQLEEYFLEDLKQEKRPVFFLASVNTATNLAIKCANMGKHVLLYSRNSDDSVKRGLIDVNETWSKVDGLIYTPTITVGVNFDIPDYFHTFYLYLTNQTCLVRDAIQASCRVRKFKSNTMYYCIKSFKLKTHTGHPLRATGPLLEIHGQLLSHMHITAMDYVSQNPKSGYSVSDLIQKDTAYDWYLSLIAYSIAEHNDTIHHFKYVFEQYLTMCNYTITRCDVKRKSKLTISEILENDNTPDIPPGTDYNSIPTINDPIWDNYDNIDELLNDINPPYIPDDRSDCVLKLLHERQSNRVLTKSQREILSKYYFLKYFRADTPVETLIQIWNDYWVCSNYKQTRSIIYNLAHFKQFGSVYRPRTVHNYFFTINNDENVRIQAHTQKIITLLGITPYKLMYDQTFTIDQLKPALDYLSDDGVSRDIRWLLGIRIKEDSKITYATTRFKERVNQIDELDNPPSTIEQHEELIDKLKHNKNVARIIKSIFKVGKISLFRKKRGNLTHIEQIRYYIRICLNLYQVVLVDLMLITYQNLLILLKKI